MSRTAMTAGLVLVMIGLIVGLDVTLFRNHFWPRLLINVGIVFVFVACYFRFVRRA